MALDRCTACGRDDALTELERDRTIILCEDCLDEVRTGPSPSRDDIADYNPETDTTTYRFSEVIQDIESDGYEVWTDDHSGIHALDPDRLESLLEDPTG